MTTDAHRPALFVFDAYGTLLDANSAVARHAAAVGATAEAFANQWRVKQLEYTWTYPAMGRWRDLKDLTAAALDTAAAMTGTALDGELRTTLLEAYETLDAYPDVAPTLRRLRAEGSRTAVLSNGTQAMLDKNIAAAGLTELFDAVLSVDVLRTFKPQQEVYGLVGRSFGTVPADVMFLSSNRWDIAGAHAFGFATTWVNRQNKPDEYGDLPPDRVITTLDQLVD